MSTELERAAETVRRHALGMPEAYEDFPWDDSVAKVGKKIFAFLGAPEGGALGLGVKLRESGTCPTWRTRSPSTMRWWRSSQADPQGGHQIRGSGRCVWA
jgi:hypothetical protein